MSALGRIFIDNTIIEKVNVPFRNIVVKNKFFIRLLKNTSDITACEDVDIINIGIPAATEYHLNKAINYLEENKVNNIIIQDNLKEFICQSNLSLKKRIVNEKLVKQASFYYAIMKFLKRIPKPVSDSSILLICDDFMDNRLNNIFLDIQDFTLKLSAQGKSITILSPNVSSFNNFEDFILDNTGLCPVCTDDLEVALSMRPNIIFNLNNRGILEAQNEIKAEKLMKRYISQSTSIFDINADNGWKYAASIIRDYNVLPPKKYRDSIPIKEFDKITGSIFNILCPDIDIGNIVSRNDINSYKNFLIRFKEEGFDISIKDKK